jgi:predicted transcriptional regulator
VAGRKLKIFAIVAGVLVLGLGAAVWSMWPEVDDIPEQLEPIHADVSIPDLELDAQGPLPAVRLGDLHGKTVYLMIEGKESMMGGEGKLLRRALHRWQLPDDVVGFSVGDAPAGAVVMRSKIESEFLAPMRSEMKLPIYIDFGGKFTTAFSLPKGHLGFVILDPAGEVVFRHAGDADETQLVEIKQLLRAEEPPPGPPAPAFSIADINNESCAGRDCVLVFLDAKVVRSEIPGLEEGGFEGEMKEAFEQIKQPSIRLARILAADWEAKDRAKVGGVLVGEAEGWDVEGWEIVAEADEARTAFGIGDQAGMVIIDEQGRVAFSEAGLIPFWKLSLAADVVGIEPKELRKRKKKD